MKSLYAAFDLYPSAKGAATHISHMVQTLLEKFDKTILFVLGNEKIPKYQFEENFEIHRFTEQIPNYLMRAESYSTWLLEKIKQHNDIKICHYRDIWSALAVLNNDNKDYKTVFEVNSLLSIELPYRYSLIKDATLKKIELIEKFCLEKSDVIITPSETIKNNLVENLKVPDNKINVITNGADIPPKYKKPIDAPDEYIIYFGAVQAWQGIDILLKSMKGLDDFTNLKLVIISSNRKRYTKAYRKFTEKLELNEKVIWKHQLSKEELYAWIQHAKLSIAPLKANSRNIEQGCSPLKIFESMACGTTVVASDIPVVKEIVQNNISAKLIRPDRPAELSRAIRLLIDYPEENQSLSKNAFKIIEQEYTWKKKKNELKNLYDRLLRK